MDALELLLTRASNGKLQAPEPDDETLQLALRAATRAPDHGSLAPFRFRFVRGQAREQLGEVFASAHARRDPSAAPEAIDKARRNPLRAPLIIVVAAQVRVHKVPAIEQVLCAGAAAYAILLTLHARGYAGIWRTGEPAYDAHVKAALGLSDSDAIVGFLYCGTPAVPAPLLKRVAPEDVTRDWSGPQSSDTAEAGAPKPARDDL